MPALAIPATKPAVKRQRRPKSAHLSMAWPDLPGSGDPLFWLAAFFRDAAQEEALRHLLYKSHDKQDRITQFALSGGQLHVQQQMHEAANYLRRDGLLLYAWQGTTCFINSPARH